MTAVTRRDPKGPDESCPPFATIPLDFFGTLYGVIIQKRKHRSHVSG